MINNNSLLVDINTFKYEVYNRTRGRLRIYLGEFIDGEFIIKVETIKHLEPALEVRIRSLIKTIILSKFALII